MAAVDLMAVSRHLEQTLGVPPLIRCNGKAPLDAAWTTGPRTDPVQWRRRLDGHRHNVGMVTGAGLLVVDVDLYHPDGEGSLDRLRDLGLPVQTVTAITGGGGRHYLYRVTEPVQSGPLAGFGGVDIKCDGGQVIVSPSVHPESGRAYEWEFNWAPGDVEPLALPESILALCRSGGEGVKRQLDERDEHAVDLLVEHFGGHHPRIRAGWVEVCRPGKDDGASATVGRLGPGVVKVWSSNWPGLTAAVYSLHELRKLAGVAEPTVSARPLQPPDGYRWWQPGDDDIPKPVLGPDAYRGPVGDYLELVAGNTEAHPAPIGFTILAHLGAWLGRSLRYVAGPIVQYPNLWGITVGPTSSGGKGVAAGTAAVLLDALDPFIRSRHALTGFGSGPALVDAVRDTDDGSVQKSRLIHDQEMAGVFRVCLMRDSTLSETLRKAFDGEPLESRTRGHGQVVATNHHIGVIGAITADELRRMMDEGSIRNGLGNRFLYLWSELVDRLPYGGRIDPVKTGRIADVIAERVTAALERRYVIEPGGPLAEVWDDWYDTRRAGVGKGAIAELTARHHVHAARLAILYAALDGVDELGPDQMRSAIAWCDYSLGTAELVFGDGVVGRARKLLDAIRGSGPEGLDGRAQDAVFGGNVTGLADLRGELEAARLIHSMDLATGGRPRLVSFGIHPLGATDKRSKGAKPDG